jgi:hypothetical protein
MSSFTKFVTPSFRALATVSLVGGFAASSALAGSMELHATIVDRWSLDFLANGLPVVYAPGGRVANGQPGHYEIELSFFAQKEGNDKGWLSTAFSAETSGFGLELFPATYSPINPGVDTFPAPPFPGLTPQYGVNQDAGSDPNDLRNIVVSLAHSSLPANHPFDKRNEVGTANAYSSIKVGPPSPAGLSGLGRFFVTWDGVGFANLEIVDHAFIFSQSPSGLGPEQTGSGDSIGFGFISDFTVDDLFVGGAPLPGGIVSAGPLPTSDEDDPDSVAWSLVSLIGPDGAEVGATVDPLTGVFTWDSALTDSEGQYVATIQGVNAGPNVGTDTGLLTFYLGIIPEPSSITLLGLATIGAFGVIRRR